MPALRERPEDVPALTEHFVQRLAADRGMAPTISEEAIARLCHYTWPGNVRELRNVLERALALCESSTIKSQQLNLPDGGPHVTMIQRNSQTRRLSDVRLEAERRELQRVLQDSGNNRTHAAQNLGISRSALYKRLIKVGLT